MNTSNETSSNQPPLPGQTPVQTIPVQNGSSNNDVTKGVKSPSICKDFTWGKCNKNKQCKFRHELIFEEMKEILKFCNDYQNPKGCTRENCTYLHTTKEEKDLFLNKRKLPRVLEKRYRAMQISTSIVETIPQIALFIKESLVGPPPPPPPLPQPQPPPVETSTSFPRMTPMLKFNNLPPPPPPPPLPTQPSTSVQPPLTPIYTAPPPQSATTNFQLNQPPTPVAKFDVSVPPPPLPTHAQIKNGALKRLSPCDDAGASKKRRTEDDIVADTLCEQCFQRNHRIEEFKEEINKLSSDEEYQMLKYKKKLEDYTSKKELLRSLVSTEMFRLVEEYVEGVPELDVLSQLSQSSFLTGMSTVPKQFLIQLMDYYFFNNARNVKSTPSPALRIEELLQSTRRPDTSHTPDRQFLLDLLASSASSPERLDLELNKNLPSESNGLHRTNRQRLNGSPPIAGYTAVAPYSMALPAATQPAMLPTLQPAVPPLTTAQPTYHTYEPTVPPPNKPYTPYSTPSTSSQNMPYCQVRMDQAPHLLRPTSTSTPVAASSNKNCHPYSMGRYPGPYYYQPYQ